MKFQNCLFISSFLLLALGYCGPGLGQDTSSRGEQESVRQDQPNDSARSGGKAWDSLDDAEKRKLREALREVWTDPAVMNAREEVKAATESYQRAIRNAISKADPSVAGALKTLQKMSEGRSEERLGGGPHGGGSPVRMMPRRSGDYPMGPPSFLESLSEEERKQFREAEKTARESEAVLQAKAKLDQLRKDDEMLRRKRMEAFREIRAATLNEMVRIDPSLSNLKERLLNSWRPGEGVRQKGGATGAPRDGKPKREE